MNYQSIRAKLEAPLLTAYNTQTPPVPVYFDNITAVPPDPPNEYVRINITFGVTTESALGGSLDYARGALIIRCFTRKGQGPARCQQLVQVAKEVLDTLNATGKTSTTTYVRTGAIIGPSFRADENSEHFMGRIDTGWQASVK